MIKTPLSTVIGGAFWTPSATIVGSASRTLNQLIKSLFANGGQGFAYDPNDLTTMFQDAAGTIPVTAAGQPVGLILDKSRGLVLGGEMVAVSAINGLPANGSFQFYSMTGKMSQLVAGKAYKITYTISGYSGTDSVGLAGAAPAGVIQQNHSSNGSYSSIQIPTTNGYFVFYTGKASTANFSNISVEELSGNHAYQTTSASRPILRQNAVTGAYYLEFDGSDDSLVTNSIDFTATDKVSLFAGVRKLSDAATGEVVGLSGDTLTTNGAFALLAPAGNGVNKFQFASKGSAVTRFADIADVALSAAISAVVKGVASISTDVCEIIANKKYAGSSALDQGTGNYGNYPLYIGRRGGTSLPFNGHIYGLIGIGKLVSDNETAAIEKELAKRTGVTLSV